MKVGDLVRIDTRRRWWHSRSAIHGQLGVIMVLAAEGALHRVILMDGCKDWFETKELEVVNETR